MRTSPKFVKIPPLNVKYTLQNGKTYMTICKTYYWHKRSQFLVYHTAQQKKTAQQKFFHFHTKRKGHSCRSRDRQELSPSPSYPFKHRSIFTRVAHQGGIDQNISVLLLKKCNYSPTPFCATQHPTEKPPEI